mgnify:CR=1 FL=1|jgi:hypothetical protein
MLLKKKVKRNGEKKSNEERKSHTSEKKHEKWFKKN